DINNSNDIKNEYGYYPGTDALFTLKNSSWRGIALTDPRIGSIIGWADTLGNMKKKYDIKSWGRVAADTGVLTRHRMAGREYDQESGLYYMRARYYDPAIGRFLSEDPIGIAGGLNLYAYSGNDPVNNRDPSGLAQEVPDPGYYAHLARSTGSGLLNDFDNNGLDDFAEFADYAFARLRWVALGLGTTDQWNAIQWALDRMMDQNYAGQVRRFMQFGRLSVADLGDAELLGREIDFRVWINSADAFGLTHYQWSQLDELQFTLAHEFAHVIQRVWNNRQGSDCEERGANIIAVKALGFDRTYGVHSYWSGC
ncbi:MAG: RHS repeat-associated core domain-containing protein, partial [Candidatus Binatia bacterium]